MVAMLTDGMGVSERAVSGGEVSWDGMALYRGRCAKRGTRLAF